MNTAPRTIERESPEHGQLFDGVLHEPSEPVHELPDVPMFLPVEEQDQDEDENFQALLPLFDAYQAAGGLQGNWPLQPHVRCPRCTGSTSTAQQAQGITAQAGRVAEPQQPGSKRKAPVVEIALGLGAVAVVVLYMAPLLLDALSLGQQDAVSANTAASEQGFPEVDLPTAHRRPVTSADIALAFAQQRTTPARSERTSPAVRSVGATSTEVHNGIERPMPDRRALSAEPVLVSAGRRSQPVQKPTQLRAQQPAQPHEAAATPRSPGQAKRVRRRLVRPSAPQATARNLADDPPSLGLFFGAPNTTGRTGTPRNKPPPLPRLDVSVNDRMQARLDVGISSSHHGDVLALLTEPVKNRKGKVIAPRNAVLVGTSTSDADRIYVRIYKLLVDGEPYGVEGKAVHRGFLGLRAKRRRASLKQRQAAEVGKGALELGKDVASELLGPAAEAARLLGEGAVDEAKRDREVDPSVVLVVPAGTEFEVVVIK